MRPSALIFFALLAFASPVSAASGLDQAPVGVFVRPGSREMLTAQVLLDRARFSPGVIDGLGGGNVTRAIRAFRRAHGLAAGDAVDRALIDKLTEVSAGPVLVRHMITDADLSEPYVARIPAGFVEQAALERLGYTSAVEALAERFHMSEALLEALNPGVALDRAGVEILVVAARTEDLSGDIARIEVDKAAGTVRVLDASGAVLASYPATIGSPAMPSPTGSMTVQAVATDAAYYFDPDKLGFGPDEKLTIAAGPNNPVGGIWIDLSEEGYGIHGSPDPRLIRKSASHGCVRLTNWDARELAEAVQPGVTVVFID